MIGVNMQLKNSSNQYGILSKFFHWSIALLVLFQFYLGLWTVWMLPQKSPTAHFYIDGLHKPLGILVCGLAILAILWKLINQHPTFPNTMPLWEKIIARLTHALLYLLVLIMAFTGTIMSTANGTPPDFFGLFQFPNFIEKNMKMAETFFTLHKYTAYLLLALIALHILAALKHHFIDRDVVLKRMLP